MNKESLGGAIPPFVGPDRPNFGPSQIRSPEELQVGMLAICHHMPLGKEEKREIASKEEKLKITSLPYREREEWWVRAISEHARALSPEKPTESEHSLADCGVVPYLNEMWHLLNWLERVENS